MQLKARFLKRKPNGFTLVGAMAAALVLAILATFIGKNIYYLIRARLRTESKVSIVDNENTLIEMIAAKTLNMIDANPVGSDPGTRCNFPDTDFTTKFNTNPPQVPGGSVSLQIENPTTSEFSLDGTAVTFQSDLKAAISGCVSKPQVPTAAKNWVGTFLFCVKIKNPVDLRRRKGQSGFLDSQAAFAEIRIDLTTSSVPQDQKMLGDASSCANWSPPAGNSSVDDTRQIKLSYRIFWKRMNDASELGYLKKIGSRVINVSEFRTN